MLVLTYKKPLEEVDRLMGSHVVWLKKHFDDGTFIACGRQIPRTGGIIIAGNQPKDKIEAIIEIDGNEYVCGALNLVQSPTSTVAIFTASPLPA